MKQRLLRVPILQVEDRAGEAADGREVFRVAGETVDAGELVRLVDVVIASESAAHRVAPRFDEEQGAFQGISEEAGGRESGRGSFSLDRKRGFG